MTVAVSEVFAGFQIAVSGVLGYVGLWVMSFILGQVERKSRVLVPTHPSIVSVGPNMKSSPRDSFLCVAYLLSVANLKPCTSIFCKIPLLPRDVVVKCQHNLPSPPNPACVSRSSWFQSPVYSGGFMTRRRRLMIEHPLGLDI